MVDDAHGLGVVGAIGRGVLELAGLDARSVPLLVGTLGKAFGGFGAFVAGDEEVIELLLQRARTYTYTTALPPGVAAAASAALRLAQRESWRREQLQARIAQFRAGAATLKLPLTGSTSPIQPLIAGDSARALRLSRALYERGFWVAAIRPPTVPVGSARLRLTLSAAHSAADVDELLAAPTVAAMVAQMPARATLIAWSLGGQLALRAAALAPERIAGLVLIGTTPRFLRSEDWPHGAEARTLEQMRAHLSEDYRGTVSDFLELQVRGSRDAAAVHAALRDALLQQGEPHPAALQAGLALLTATDLRAQLASIRVPTLVIAGQYDQIGRASCRERV